MPLTPEELDLPPRPVTKEEKEESQRKALEKLLQLEVEEKNEAKKEDPVKPETK